jgi:methyl-accepting chemotaxis protein
MPHWLQILLSVAGAVAAWRWVLRPLRRAWRELLQLLRQIRDASGGVQRLAREMEALSGALVNFVTQILSRQDEHHERLNDASERLNDISELYVDLAATVARNRRRIDQIEGAHREDDTPPAD